VLHRLGLVRVGVEALGRESGRVQGVDGGLPYLLVTLGPQGLLLRV
jgi:hypothetical protein